MSQINIIVDNQTITINRNELTEEAITNLLTVAIKSKLLMVRHLNKPIPLSMAILNICKCGKSTCK
ncbi:MAG: hypothetical protein DRQ39_11360 [Gammaproteobacteria bacterium]|nr:MAG: hypothetical protein DRQ39_11360 [Gammaproteobacteria bacterium]